MRSANIHLKVLNKVYPTSRTGASGSKQFTLVDGSVTSLNETLNLSSPKVKEKIIFLNIFFPFLVLSGFQTDQSLKIDHQVF